MAQCEVLNILTGARKVFASMNFPRDSFEAIEVEDDGASKIMVFGGYGPGEEKLKSIETYHPSKDKWTVETDFDLDINLSHYSAVNLGHKIYILGGDNDIGTINIVRYFTYLEKKWHFCSPMTQARSSFATVIGADRKIYAIGGLRDGKRLSHTERYCPDSDKWEVLAEMNEGRASHSAIAMPNGFIYAIGG